MTLEDKDIEGLIRQLPVQCDVQAREATLRDTLAAYEESRPIRSAGAPSTRNREMIAKALKRLAPPAAAGIAIALIAWLIPGTPIAQNAYAELLQAVQNSRESEWVHIREIQDGREKERWLSVQPLREAYRTPTEISYCDITERNRFLYDPSVRTVTILPLELPENAATTFNGSFLDYMMMVLKDLEKQGAQVNRSQVTFEGRRHTLFTIRRVDAAEVRTIQVDPEFNRVVRMETKRGSGAPLVQHLDYPVTGPQDIYALGAPRDAYVNDRRHGPTTRPRGD